MGVFFIISTFLMIYHRRERSLYLGRCLCGYRVENKIRAEFMKANFERIFVGISRALSIVEEIAEDFLVDNSVCNRGKKGVKVFKDLVSLKDCETESCFEVG